MATWTARLAIYVPKVVGDLESGDLNLSQVSLLQKSIRSVQLDSKAKVDQKTKEDLVNLLSNKSFAESEVLVARVLDIAPVETIKITNQKDESVRLQVTLSKSQWEKLLKMRELLSNTLPGGSNWDQVLECAADKVIKLKDKAARSTRITNTSVAAQNDQKKNSDNQNTEPTPPSSQPRQYIPISTQRKVFQRDQCCQYIDKVTGKKCESKWHLQIDHIQPVWANGTNMLENLRLLCAGHNQENYRWQANITRHH